MGYGRNANGEWRAITTAIPPACVGLPIADFAGYRGAPSVAGHAQSIVCFSVIALVDL